MILGANICEPGFTSIVCYDWWMIMGDGARFAIIRRPELLHVPHLHVDLSGPLGLTADSVFM